MSARSAVEFKWKQFVQRHRLVAFFILSYAISWSGAAVIAVPHLLRGAPLTTTQGLLMFPVMLLGPSVTGVLLTWMESGSDGLRDLWNRVLRVKLPSRWYASILIPPVLILLVLKALSLAVSPAYVPSNFFVGALFGVPAGLLEEIGWMGYAFPRMCATRKPLTAAILLGLLWSFWHVPVINFLGTSAPHGSAWPAFFFSFTAAMTAIRVLIGWTYANTGSVFLAQLLHISSTGSLVVLSPVGIMADQEALWYAVYAAALWAVAAMVAL